MNLLQRAVFILMSSVIVFAVGCGSETTPVGEDDFFEGEMWPYTHQMVEADVAQVISMDANGTLTIAKGSPILTGLAPKHVLLAGDTTKTPRGMLRRVTEITDNGTTVEVKTEQALLQHAFKSLHAKFTRPVNLASSDVIWDTAPGAKLLDSTENTSLKSRKSGGGHVGPVGIDYYPFNGDNDTTSDEDQIHVVATFDAGINYNFGIDFDWPDWDDALSGDPIPEITVGYSVDAGASASVNVDGVAMYSYDRQDTLGHAGLGSFWIGPLFFTVSVDLLSKIEGGAASRFIMNTGASASFVAAAEYSTDDGGRLIPPTATYSNPDSTITATETAFIKVSVGPRLRLALYDIFGPHVTVWAFGELSADSTRDPCWDLRAGVYGDIGIDLTIFGETIADWSAPFDIWDTSILSGECIPDPDAPEVPDLIDPLFEPWSKLIVDTATSWDLDRDFLSIEGAVDGHWLIGGSGTSALSKMASDGRLLWSRSYTEDNATLQVPMSMNRAVNTRDLGIFATSFWPVMLMKLDADGGVVWSKKPDLEFQPVVGMQVLLENDDGSVYVGGPFMPDDTAYSDAWIYKLDKDGNVLWSRTWGIEDTWEWVTGFVRLGDDLLVTGQSFGVGQDPAHQSFAIRMNSDGTAEWIAEIKGGPGTDGVSLRKSVISSDGDIIAGGSYGTGGPDQILIKLKPNDPFNPAIGWVNGNRAAGALGIDLTDFFQLSDGGYLLAGLWWTGGTDSVWVARTDSVGRMTWLRKYETWKEGVQIECGSPAIVMTGDGGAMVAAYSDQGKDNASMWFQRIPIKTGEIDLDGGYATVSTASFSHDQNPALVIVPSPVPLVDRPVTMIDSPVTSQRITPTTTDFAN